METNMMTGYDNIRIRLCQKCKLFNFYRLLIPVYDSI